MLKRAIIWINLLHKYIRAYPGCDAKILNPQETIQHVVRSKKSIIRLGDGEFGLFHGYDVHYQDYSQELLDYFIQMKEEYIATNGNTKYLLCVPNLFFKSSGLYLLRKRVYISSWAESKYDFCTTFRQDIEYGDAFTFAKGNDLIYENLWKSVSTVVFIHNNQHYAQEFRVRYKKKVFYIEVPPNNAYEVIHDIEDRINACISSNNVDNKDSIFLISAGPTGKVMAYNLTRAGFWAIDMGHCWDQPLEVEAI